MKSNGSLTVREEIAIRFAVALIPSFDEKDGSLRCGNPLVSTDLPEVAFAYADAFMSKLVERRRAARSAKKP